MLKRSCWCFVWVAVWLSPVWAEVHVIDPIQDTFVVDPGSGSKHTDAADQSYGGAGSRSVAAATARAVDEDAGIDQDPKGEFISLLQFDLSQVAELTSGSVGLNLYISNGNEAAAGIFNYRGHAGTFRVDWISNDWEQGYGTPKKSSDVGITYNALMDLLDESGQTWIADCVYDGNNAYGDPQWYRFELPLDDEDLCAALQTGGAISLMISPADDEVAFNFTAYTQLNVTPSKINIRDTGPYLDIETVAYRSIEEFEADTNSVLVNWETNVDSGLLTTGPVIDTMAYDGNQCLQLEFDNDGEILWEGSTYTVETYAETTYSLSPTLDWTARGGTSFSLAWAGDATNTLTETDRLYVQLEDRSTAVSEPVYCDSDLSETDWHLWTVALSDFSGVNLRQIKRVTVGVGHPVDPQVGGSGTIWIDALRVYDGVTSSIPGAQ